MNRVKIFQKHSYKKNKNKKYSISNVTDRERDSPSALHRASTGMPSSSRLERARESMNRESDAALFESLFSPPR